MPIFEYEAKTIQGVSAKGNIEAQDKRSVINILRNKGYYPIFVRKNIASNSLNLQMLLKIKIKDIAVFCRQFSVIISAGIPVMRALEIIRDQTENKRLKNVIFEIFEDVQKGKTLSEAMKMHKEFPEMLSDMVTVGEASGTLDIILERMAIYYEKDFKLNQNIKTATTYPIVIVIFAIGVLILLLTVVLPLFVDMLQSAGGKLPLPTRILMTASDFVRTKWYIVIVVVIALTVGIKAYISAPGGRYAFDKLKLTLPIIGKLYRKICKARYARTFGILVSSGIPLMNSLEICANVIGNAVIKEALDSTKSEIQRGLSLGETLETRRIFPPMLTQMIRIGEESGMLDSILESTAGFYDEEVDNATETLTTLIQPVIIIFLGVAVGFVIISILLPMFELYNAMGSM